MGRLAGIAGAVVAALVCGASTLTNGQLVWWVTGKAGGSRVLRLALP